MLSLSLLLGFYMERMLEVLYQLMLLDLLMWAVVSLWDSNRVARSLC